MGQKIDRWIDRSPNADVDVDVDDDVDVDIDGDVNVDVDGVMSLLWLLPSLSMLMLTLTLMFTCI